MTKQHSEDIKILAVKYYKTHLNKVKTCDIFECTPRSLGRWIEKYDDTGSIKNRQREYKSYKITQEQVKFIITELKKDKTITIDDLLKKVKNKYNDLELSRMHLSRIVRDNNITLKQTRLRHEPIIRYGQPINIKKQIDDIICIDETSLNGFMTRYRCYEKIGKRCLIKTDNQEVFKKYTGIFAISTDGVIGYEIYDKGGIDSDRLIIFLNKYITNKYSNKLIILDNASSHRNYKVKQLINEKNKILYSVPYQHYTNSIEQYFSLLKNRLKKQKGIGLITLKNNIKEIIETLPKNMYKNIFKGSYERNKEYKKYTSRRIRPPKKYKI